jgi:hypothetical protein
MPERYIYEPGAPCWVDLSAPDVEASIDFCSMLFKWAVETLTDLDHNHIYSMFSRGGLYMAGLSGLPPEMDGTPPFWSTYICVENAEETCEMIVKAGGQIVVPATQMYESGWLAVALDPTGVHFRIWQPMDHIGAGMTYEPNTWAWAELVSSDLDRAKKFYSEVFDWTFDAIQTGHADGYLLVRVDESEPLAGLMGRPPGMPADAPDHWAVYFSVADIQATIDEVVGQGGQVLFGPAPIPGVGQIATLTHPLGGVFSLLEPPTS